MLVEVAAGGPRAAGQRSYLSETWKVQDGASLHAVLGEVLWCCCMISLAGQHAEQAFHGISAHTIERGSKVQECLLVKCTGSDPEELISYSLQLYSLSH